MKLNLNMKLKDSAPLDKAYIAHTQKKTNKNGAHWTYIKKSLRPQETLVEESTERIDNGSKTEAIINPVTIIRPNNNGSRYAVHLDSDQHDEDD